MSPELLLELKKLCTMGKVLVSYHNDRVQWKHMLKADCAYTTGGELVISFCPEEGWKP